MSSPRSSRAASRSSGAECAQGSDSFSILDLIADPALLGPWYQGESWDAWRAVFAGAYGLRMSRQQARLFERLTKRKPPGRPVKEVIAAVGRRGGKDSAAAAALTHAGAFVDHRPFLRAGELATCLALAVDRSQARRLLGYVKGYFRQVPLLRELVTREVKDGLELSTGAEIIVAPNSHRSTRGGTVAFAVINEAAFLLDEGSAISDIEVYRALVPAMATIPTSMLWIISSTYRKSGLLFSKIAQHYGQVDPDVLAILGTSLDFNPALDRGVIDRAMADDPIAARCEFFSEFRDDIGTFLDRLLLEQAVDRGVLVRPPIPGVAYACFVDPSGGSHDSFAAAIGHKEPTGVVVDLAWERKAPFSPATAVEDLVGILRSYRISKVTGDRYGAGWSRAAFERLGVAYAHSKLERSSLYAESLPAFTSARVRLIDNPRIVAQFASLERRTSPGGKDRIDHPPSRLASDDLSNCVAGVVWLLQRAAETAVAIPAADLSLGAPVPGPAPWRDFDTISGERIGRSVQFEQRMLAPDAWSPGW